MEIESYLKVCAEPINRTALANDAGMLLLVDRTAGVITSRREIMLDRSKPMFTLPDDNSVLLYFHPALQNHIFLKAFVPQEKLKPIMASVSVAIKAFAGKKLTFRSEIVYVNRLDEEVGTEVTEVNLDPEYVFVNVLSMQGYSAEVRKTITDFEKLAPTYGTDLHKEGDPGYENHSEQVLKQFTGK